jgi:hypothetical protein
LLRDRSTRSEATSWNDNKENPVFGAREPKEAKCQV